MILSIREIKLMNLPAGVLPGVPGASMLLQVEILKGRRSYVGRALGTTMDPINNESLKLAETCLQTAKDSWGASLFAWWIQFRESLEKIPVRPGLERLPGQIAGLLEWALLDASLQAEPMSLHEWCRKNPWKIDFSLFGKRFKELRPADWLPAPGSVPLQSRLLLPEKFDPAILESLEERGHFHLSIRLDNSGKNPGDQLIEFASHILEYSYPLKSLHVIAHSAFKDAEEFRAFWEKTGSAPPVMTLWNRTSAIIDPFPVDTTWSSRTLEVFAEWPKRPVILLNEAYQSWHSAWKSLDRGYAGVYHRPEKGVVMALLTRCFYLARADREPVGRFIFEAELSSPANTLSFPLVAAFYSALGLNNAFVPCSLTDTPLQLVDSNESQQPFQSPKELGERLVKQTTLLAETQ